MKKQLAVFLTSIIAFLSFLPVKAMDREIFEENGYLYTKSYRPKQEQSVESFTEGSFTGGTMKIDLRSPVIDTDTDEWRVHGQVTMKFDNSDCKGTGVLIRNGTGVLIGKKYVLTAGHNLYDPKKRAWASDVQFNVGKNGEKTLYHSVESESQFVLRDWRTNGNKDHDMGVIVLKEHIGNRFGWNGLLCMPDDQLRGLEVHVGGYPGDKEGNTMWAEKGKVDKVTRNTFSYKLSTEKGESGANPWILYKAHYLSLGVHTYSGGRDSFDYCINNSATRLTEERLRDLVKLTNDEGADSFVTKEQFEQSKRFSMYNDGYSNDENELADESEANFLRSPRGETSFRGKNKNHYSEFYDDRRNDSRCCFDCNIM